VLDALATIAPVHAVLGNDDHGVVLPERSRSSTARSPSAVDDLVPERLFGHRTSRGTTPT
jgi:hypothetical protein